ncbi:hypothetical protein Nepgr_006566 [Nepenthes gracilis]|uniref:Uncharacterized protein n=1 Tax=Nepenthes gracilis TaxID=150966 RepID=A0AAD3XHQ5_NEPGR|nr:hypothetical protein Nepgr_006566 [Nepenthes gracilis]
MPLMIHFSDDGEVGDAEGLCPSSVALDAGLFWCCSWCDCLGWLDLAVYLNWLLGVTPNPEAELVACYYLELVAEFKCCLLGFTLLICNEWQSYSDVDEQQLLLVLWRCCCIDFVQHS